MKWLREFRLIPVALIGIVALFILKAAGLLLDGGYTLGPRLSRGETITVTTVPASSATQLRAETLPLNATTARPAGTRSWMQEMFGYPEVTGSTASRVNPNDSGLIAGSVAASKP